MNTATPMEKMITSLIVNATVSTLIVISLVGGMLQFKLNAWQTKDDVLPYDQGVVLEMGLLASDYKPLSCPWGDNNGFAKDNAKGLMFQILRWAGHLALSKGCCFASKRTRSISVEERSKPLAA